MSIEELKSKQKELLKRVHIDGVQELNEINKQLFIMREAGRQQRKQETQRKIEEAYKKRAEKKAEELIR